MYNGFSKIDTSIYKKFQLKYRPETVKYLIVAESPPAFKELNKGAIPSCYFYFENVPKADSLFYTLIKAIYDLDFEKSKHNRIEFLNQFKNNGFYLVDSVDYPINKSIDWVDIPNFQREQIIIQNKQNFDSNIISLMNNGNINKNTRTILIKETVYNQHHNNRLLNVINTKSIGFPQYIKDRETINTIRRLIKYTY